MSQRVRPIAVVIGVFAALMAPIAPGGAAAADDATGSQMAPIQVPVEALGPMGISGVALLSTAAAGTAVQLLAVGAPADTTAIVHVGACDAIDPTLVALLGDVSATGQIQTTIPVPFDALTDGRHVIVFHPGLDLSTAVACGRIPATDGVADSGPPPVDQPPIQDPAAPDPGCLGVADWVAATEARLDRVSELLDEADGIAARMDVAATAAALASLEGELQAMVARQSQEPVPPVAGDVNQDAISAYEALAGATRRTYEALTFSTDPASSARAAAAYEEAAELMGEVGRDLGRLRGECAVPQGT